jgi:8-oxo-dGTP diphosphatase
MAEPILGASACVWRDGKVLLIQRGKQPGKGLWSLPGGKVEIGEQVESAAVRELFEETQVVADLAHAMGPFEVWRDGILIYSITCFAGHYVSGEAVAGSDAAEVAWVYPQALGGFELAPNIAQAIAQSAKVLKL